MPADLPADLRVTEIWVSEHYWPALAAELVTAQAQRLTRSGALAAVVLPGEQTAFGLHVAHDADDVRHALRAAGLGHGSIGAGWLMDHAPAPAARPA
ncbi:hypothetical protein [Nocardioides stalactiti]|uniref:hypothetical protein n=1 Tax=Nocardioides stalactiti TaxID=2755356 RepID=UPI0015FF2CEA|nr:hypothetical protein [Nocardioides stalactiti]